MSETTSVNMPPPPPVQDNLIRWKRTTIQHRNHYNPETKKQPERDALHQRHHPDSWSHARLRTKPKGKKGVRGQENIRNLIVTSDNVDECGCEEQMREMMVQTRQGHEVLQRHLGPLDSHGRPASPSAPAPPMFKAPIPKNAQRPKYSCVGFMGGGTGVADPRKFVKAKSGGIGPTVLKGAVTKPGEKARKWERPLDDNFKPKMGKPKVEPKKKDCGQMEGKVPKRNFLEANKASAAKVVVKNKAEIPKKLELGKNPAYLQKRR